MKVECIAECRERINSTTTKTYPKGWKGTVDDALGSDWVAAGTARKVSDSVAFTNDEAAVLKVAAQHALQAAQAGGGEDSQDPADAIRALSYEDLKVLAKDRGVVIFRRKRVDIEADLIAQVEGA